MSGSFKDKMQGLKEKLDNSSLHKAKVGLIHQK